MKKILTLLSLIILTLILVSCSKNVELIDNYNDNTFGYIELNKEEVKILQLTDLHLTYGFDYLDRQTYKLIDSLIKHEEPDIIVVTGDLFMSILGKQLLTKFIKFMEQYKIPWTFIFGNHEIDYHKSMEEIVNVVYSIDTSYLYFHHGPKLSNNNSHGHSNFKLKLTNNGTPILYLYMLDSKANRTDGVIDQNFPYDYVSVDQVNWYKEEVLTDTVESLLFVHIPLMEYLEYPEEPGEQIWPQGLNTGLFDEIVSANKTRAVFVGHDHLNNFEFIYQEILLAYGNATGYNSYGTNPKGARIIIYNSITKELNTYLTLDKEVLK